MTNSAIPSVRSFNRAVTQRIGIFTDRFLGRDRPLGEARLIFEIGRDGDDVRQLRARLGLDSGYLSRLLRSLERQGLIEVVPLESDRRVRQACLTADGEIELAELDRRSDDFALGLLEPLSESQRERLVEAMDQVERLLSLSFSQVSLEDPSSADARWCLDQYFAELASRFEEGFDVSRSIAADDLELRPPRGAFVVARLDGRPIGCGAVKTLSPATGSIKRMWVAKSARGIGIGRRILLALEQQAAALGFRVLRLETNRTLAEAQKLYRRSGYRQVAAFNDDPYADFWFEKELDDPAGPRHAGRTRLPQRSK